MRRPVGEAGGVGLVVLLLLVLGGGGFALWSRMNADEGSESRVWSLTPPLERARLRLTILESGSLEAVDPHVIVNRVEGRTSILSIVPEGTVVTPADVEAGRILVRLDSSDLEERIAKQALEVQTAESSRVNARSTLAIQLNQNASDLRKAELDLRFARLDLERYVGSVLASRLSVLGAPPAVDGGEGGAAAAPLDSKALIAAIDGLLDDAALDGEARQRIRELESEIRLADEERRRAEDKHNHSVKLEGRGFISREELDADGLALQRRTIEAERARTARLQFVRYDFPKEAQRLLSDVVEAGDKLKRAHEKAEASERKERSALATKEEQHLLQVKRFAFLEEQIKLCTIRASKDGMVVYASSGKERSWRSEDRIQEGTSVRQRQALLRIPRPNLVSAKVSVHESVVRRVQVGQEAWITVDAQPGSRLEAKVSEVSRLPSSADRWWNPNLKVYGTELEVMGEHPQLRPGMSCSVEILTGDVADALAVPTQAVVGTVDHPAVYVYDEATGLDRRDVDLGGSNDTLVEVTSGLEPGMRVVLNPPKAARPSDADAALSPEAARDGTESGADGAPAKRGAGKRGGQGARRGR